MAQHTPAPWRVAFGNRLEVHGPNDEIGWPASIVFNAGLCTSEEAQANARLIAAAPDLLDMCERLLGFALFYGEPTAIAAGDGMINAAKALIAQAKGGAA